MSLKDEAIVEFKKLNGAVNFESFIAGSKWMAERNIETIRGCFNPAKAISQIKENIKELS